MQTERKVSKTKWVFVVISNNVISHLYQAVKNENVNDKVIRQLKEEIEKLKQQVFYGDI